MKNEYITAFAEAIEGEQPKLMEDAGIHYAIIHDAELDPMKSVFFGDGCVEIDVSDYTYVTFTHSQLFDMMELIEKADQKIAHDD